MKRTAISHTLPARWYVDPGIYEQERQQIFARTWWPVGPEQSLAEAGAYRAECIAGWPLLVLRGNDGQLRAFHNVCRHRAAPLLKDGTGQCNGTLRCPYHGWLYDDTGCLQSAPRFLPPDTSQKDGPGHKDDLDFAQWSLFPLRVACWRGLIFVCMDPSAPSLAQWLGSADKLCQPFPPATALEFYGEYRLEGAANWKTYCDNTVEGYHLASIHPRLAKSLARGTVTICAYDRGRNIAFHVRYGSGSDGAALRGDDGLWLYHFPSFQLVAGPQGFKAERIEPAGPGSVICPRPSGAMPTPGAVRWCRKT